MAKSTHKHDCIKQINLELQRELQNDSATVVTTIPLVTGVEPQPLISAHYYPIRKDGRFQHKAKEITLVASYCPFCGKKLRSSAK